MNSTLQKILDGIWDEVVGEYHWLKSVIFGEFEDNRPISAVAADMLVSFVPGVIIVTSARDLVAVTLRLARYPEKREEVGEWILLIGCTIPLILPLLAAAVGAAAAGVGAIVGGIGGSEAGAALRAVCLMLIEKGGVMLEAVMGFLRRFVKGDVLAVLRDIKFAQYGEALAKYIDKSIAKLLEIVKALQARLLELPQWQWVQNEIGPIMAKLQEWEHRFYALQSSAVKNIPKALSELDSRLADVLKQDKPRELHMAQTGVHAEPPKPETPKEPVKVATQRGNPLGTPPNTEHPPPQPPKPPKKDNVHSQDTKKAKIVGDASGHLAPHVYHITTSPGAADGVVKGINPAFLNPNSRFGAAFYVAEQPETALAELAHHSAEPSTIIKFSTSEKSANVLDLTDSDIAASWGYAGGPITPATQAIASKAQGQGYNVIRYYSERAPGTVNYAILDNYNEILTPIERSPVNP